MSKNRRRDQLQIGGSFLRYILWAAIFLTMQGIGTWFASLGLGLNGFNIGFGTGELGPIAAVVTRFVQDVVLVHLVPVIAAALVVKAIFDIGERHNPLPSIISALFLLGIQGLFTIFQSWNDGSDFATTDFLVTPGITWPHSSARWPHRSRLAGRCWPTYATVTGCGMPPLPSDC